MCVTPNFVWIAKGAGHVQQQVACGDCWRCRANRVNGYIGRALCEADRSDWTLSLTLTYAPRGDLAEKVITPQHFQDFIRSLRDTKHKIRYLACGEYGEKKGRAHFHAILFGMGKKPLAHQSERRVGALCEMPESDRCWLPAWPHGHTYSSWLVNPRAFRYICKYVLKAKDEKKGSKDHWFTLSKKPPLGWAWFADHAAELVALGTLPASFHYNPPGSDKGTPYLMTGATKRDFVLAVCDGWRRNKELSANRLNEWVAMALEKAERDLLEKELRRQPVDGWMDKFRKELDRKRPTDKQLARHGWDVLEQDGTYPAALQPHLTRSSKWHVPDEEAEPEIDDKALTSGRKLADRNAQLPKRTKGRK